MRYLAQALLLLLIFSNAKADDSGLSGAKLAQDCRVAAALLAKTRPPDQRAFLHALACTAYVRGFTDSAFIHEVKGYPTLFCLPENATLNQEIAVVSQWLDTHPAKWNEPAGLVVAKAFVDAFPCKDRK